MEKEIIVFSLDGSGSMSTKDFEIDHQKMPRSQGVVKIFHDLVGRLALSDKDLSILMQVFGKEAIDANEIDLSDVKVELRNLEGDYNACLQGANRIIKRILKEQNMEIIDTVDFLISKDTQKQAWQKQTNIWKALRGADESLKRVCEGTAYKTIFLLTDGEHNVIADRPKIVDFANELHERSIRTVIIGVGKQLDKDMLYEISSPCMNRWLDIKVSIEGKLIYLKDLIYHPSNSNDNRFCFILESFDKEIMEILRETLYTISETERAVESLKICSN